GTPPVALSGGVRQLALLVVAVGRCHSGRLVGVCWVGSVCGTWWRGGCSTGKRGGPGGGPRRGGRWGGAVRGDVMAQQKRGLGKGLGALIPTAPSSVGRAGASENGPGSEAGRASVAGDGAGAHGAEGTYLEEVAIGAITPNPRQPRQSFDEDTLEELALSIREV